MASQEPQEYALYLRKSKGRTGVARQRTTTTAHIERLGGRVVAEFVDTDRTAYQKVDAARPRRDGFTAMVAMLRAKPGLGVTAWHADRLSRNSEDTEELIRVCASGGHFVETRSGGSYDLSTATGRKRFRSDALDATFEVDHMTERIVAMKAEHAAEGRWLGGRRPFGWRPDRDAPGGLVLEPAEAEPLAQAHRDILDRTSLHSVARGWNAAGIVTAGGKQWTGNEVRRVLLRPMNAAPPPAQWPAIVDADTHRAVVALVSDPKRKTTPGPERRHLLSGLALCGKCGTPLFASSCGSKRGPRTVYRCPKARGGGHVARDEASLDDYITKLVIERLSRPDAETLLLKQTASDLPRLERERGEVQELMRASNDLRRRGLLSLEEFAEERAEHQDRLAVIEAKIAAAEQIDVVAPMLRDPAGIWASRDLDQRRAVVDALMIITVKPQRKGRPAGWIPGTPYFDENTIEIEGRSR